MKSALIVRHVPYEGCAGYRVPVEAAIGGDGVVERASPRTLWLALQFGE